ncbi:hypothetical protein F4679DRAFT_28524 [Xylaria curta]|nr:hypothetical protein F4679DRAFT_28524 [Xylaria curta]
MPITPFQPSLWPGEHEGNKRDFTSLSQVSEPKFPPNHESHSQKPIISQAPIENTQSSLHCVQGEPSSQQPQRLEEMPLTFDPTELPFGISDPPNDGAMLDIAVCRTLSPNDTPESMVTSASSSELNSQPSDGVPLTVTLEMSIGSRDAFSPYAVGTPKISYLWDEVDADFDKPFTLSASFFSPDRIDKCKHNSFNDNNKEGELPEPPPSLNSSNVRELCRFNMDDIKPPPGESTEGSSLSNSTPRSADESTTSSDYEDDIISDTSDVLKPLIEPLLQKLLSAYSRYTLGKKSEDGEAKQSSNSGVPGSAISVATGKQTVTGHQYSRNSNPTKRKRQDLSRSNDNGEDEDEEKEPPPRKRVEQLKEDALLACPFVKWKPLSYRSCHKYIMKDIRRVKQHLRRNHMRPLYCPTCWETFKVEETFYSHIEGRSCLPKPKRELEGVTSTQQGLLEHKADRKLSRSDQWYAIFSILFPDSPRPRSAYLESDLSAELLDFQNFMATDGLEIVEQTVHEQIPTSLIPQTEEIVTFSQVVFQQAIPEILKKYEATRPHNSSPDSGYESLDLTSSSHSMTDEHKVDEGTRMEPIFETIDPIPKDTSRVDYTTSCAPNDLLGLDDNVENFLEPMIGMEEFLSSDVIGSEDV